MDNLHLVTGYLGNDHIKAVDQGAFNAALIGTGQFVLDKGKVFEAQVINNNQIRVYDGEMMMQGRFIRLEPDTYVDLTIENGAQGVQRNDLIAVRYTKDTLTGVEGVNLVVIKGDAVESNPVDPEHTEADITNGDAVLHEFPLWRIPIDGLNAGKPVALYGELYADSMQTLPYIRNQMKQLTSDIFATAARIEVGSYTGNGSVQFELHTKICPKIVILSRSVGGIMIQDDIGTLTIIENVTKYCVYNTNNGTVYLTVQITYDSANSEYKIVFGLTAPGDYSGADGKYIFNDSGKNYHYVIVGN